MCDSEFLDYFDLKPEDVNVKIDVQHINEIAKICIKEWDCLHTKLGIDTKDIAATEAGSSQNRSLQIICLWKKQNGREATYKRLIDALIKIKSREEAESVCEILKSQKATVLERGATPAGIN